MDRLSRMLKALSDPTRLRIVHLLAGRDELCVCELVGALSVAQYSISRHLGILKAAGVVDDWRQGKWMHYTLARGLSPQDRALVQAVCDSARPDPQVRQDRRRLDHHLRPRRNGDVVCET